MFRKRAARKILLIGDLLLIFLAFLLAYYLRKYSFDFSDKPFLSVWRYLWAFGVALITWLGGAFFLRLYLRHPAYNTLPQLVKIIFIASGTGVIITFVAFFFRELHMSRLFILFFACHIAIFTCIFHMAYFLLIIYHRYKGYNIRSVLIAGHGQQAVNMADHLTAIDYGIKVAGIISMVKKSDKTAIETDELLSEDKIYHGKDGNQYPFLGHIFDLASILENHVIDEVIFIVDSRQMKIVEQGFSLCEELGVSARLMLDFFPRRIARAEVDNLEGVPLLSFVTTPTNQMALAIKRSFDVLFSLVVLICGAPFFLLIAALIKATSNGPIFYRQVRSGQNGRQFILYKFRTMDQDAEQHQDEVRCLNQMSGPVFKSASDPRLTKIGRLLRSFSLDELPQFYNVLAGDMSIVGPRPPLPSEVQLYKRWQRRRLSVRPGITCIWQVSGRNQVDFNRWMEMDLFYIDNWSLWMDTKIFLRTIPAVLSRRGAY